MKKILLLGSGELGKELTISLKRIGCNVIACDSYENAPAMQVSDKSEVFNMLDEKKLKEVINKGNKEVGKMSSEKLSALSKQGIPTDLPF